MAIVTPTTELKAVNLILRNVGEAPVSSVGDALEAAQAYETLLEISRDIQNEGWYFNTEWYNFTPDNYGYIKLPNNTLAVRAVDEDEGIPVTNRNGKLYNLTPYQSGPIWTKSMKVELILGLSFDELPEAARRLIALKAARVYQAREQSDDLSLREDSQDEQKAYADLVGEDIRLRPANMLKSRSVFRVAYNGYTGPALYRGAFR